jgi:hypothetical protein
VYRICDYILSTSRQPLFSEIPIVVKEQLKNKFKDDKITSIDIVDELIPLFLLLILNPRVEYFVQFTPSSANVSEVLQRILSASGLKVRLNSSQTDVKCQIGICYPPFMQRSGIANRPTELEEVLAQKERLFSSAFQFFIGVNSVLFSGGNKGRVRDFVLETHQPTAIYVLPFESKFTGIRSISAIVFDLSNSYRNILMGDFNESMDSERILTIIKKRTVVEGVTALVYPDDLRHNEWVPSRFVHSQLLMEIDDKNILKIEDVISSFTRGLHINSQNLYQQGEIKYISTKDLDQSNVHFIFKDGILGVDDDEFRYKTKLIKKNNVLVTLN